MPKIVTTQPAKEGETITVTDKQGRSYSAEATTEIVDNKGIAFRDGGKIKVTGNSNSTQQSRTVLDRHTPKRKKSETTSPKILSYIEEDGEYKFYLWGDRNPQLIYSLPNTDEIVWGNISTQSQGKNDWVVGILYWDDDLPIIIPEQYRVGDLEYLQATDGLYNTGGYVLAIITSNSTQLFNINDTGLALAYLRPSGNGYFGNYDLYFMLQEQGYNNIFNPNWYIKNQSEQIFETFNIEINDPTPSPIERVLYSANFTSASKYTILSDVFPKSIVIPNLSNINNSGSSFFTGLPNFNNWIAEGFVDQDHSLDQLTPYSMLQIDEGDNSGLGRTWFNWSVSNPNQSLVNWLFAEIDDNINDGVLYTHGYIYNRSASVNTRTLYTAKSTKKEGHYPRFLNFYECFSCETKFFEQYSVVIVTDLDPEYFSSGQNIVVNQITYDCNLYLPIFNKDIITENSLVVEYNKLICNGLTRYIPLNDQPRVISGDRRTDIESAKSGNLGFDLVIKNESGEYNYFYYYEKELTPVSGKRLEYQLPVLRYYESPQSGVIEFIDYKLINNIPTIQKTSQYWNGSSFSEVAIPSEYQYYLELRNGKFQGINVYDLELGKKEVTLHTWPVGSELGTPKTKKIQVKKYPEGHTILSASYGK